LGDGCGILVSEAQWRTIEPLLPGNQPGARRTDDRRVISGIVYVPKKGLPLAGLAIRLWSADHDFQPLSSLDDARAVAAAV
jgi:transposase